jgi:glucosamine--fructose-6-phosphate aminotransferase (isomerizing)
MSTYSEILEQQNTIGHILASQENIVMEVARAIKNSDPQYLFVAARGSSDNAARYANYLFGNRNGLALALATPSLFTYYQTPPRLTHSVVIGISQSGQSPDILSVLEEGRKQHCLTIAITNNPDSPLAKMSDLVLNLEVGQEKAVAATKTYTAELTLLAMISAALRGEKSDCDDLACLPGWAGEALHLDAEVEQLVHRFSLMENCVVLGRGYNYSTAFEWALKLKELTYVKAEPYSSADFLHGPVAMIGGGFPILAVVANGCVVDTMQETLQFLKNDLKAELVIISNDSKTLNLARNPLLLPKLIPEWLSPIVTILPAQLFAFHLAKARGYDPDNPRTIHKVTLTK